MLVRKNIKEIQGSVLAGWPVEPLTGPDRWDLALPETGALITAEKTLAGTDWEEPASPTSPANYQPELRAGEPQPGLPDGRKYPVISRGHIYLSYHLGISAKY